MKKFLSIMLSILMVVTMIPMAVLPASAATEATDMLNSSHITYSAGLTQYIKYNSYLYKVVYTNMTLTKVDIDYNGYYLHLRHESGYSFLLTSYQGKLAEIDSLPTSPGSTVSYYVSSSYVSDEKKPVVSITCLAVGEPVWKWTDSSSATATFTSTDGKAKMTVDATIEVSMQTAENCLENDFGTYTATATANGKVYTNIKNIEGAQGPHNFEYIKSGNTVIGSCTNGCGTICNHTWTDENDYLCDICGFECYHESYYNGICVDCGYICKHNNIVDNKCTTCDLIGCFITINMVDWGYDGWNGNSVIIKKLLTDGSFKEIGIATLEDGSKGTYDLFIGSDDIFTLTYVKGFYPSECTFTVDIDGETVFTSAFFDNYEEGEIVYTNCEHTFEDSVCNICDYICQHENIADGECPTCGFTGKFVTINMTDEYGDGWNDTAIIISKLLTDGSFKEIGIATLEDGSEGTYDLVIGSDDIFNLTCVKGIFPAQCTFTVDINGETVFTSESFDNYEEGEIVYTNCEHTFEDGVCNICDYICQHKNIADGECPTCGFTGKVITINMTDDAGDGWNGAKVIISKLLADGSYEEIGSATLKSGSEGTFVLFDNQNSTFTLTCTKGIYPFECTFTVDIDGETVFESETLDYYEKDEILYTICEHTFEDCVCTKCGYECITHDWSHKDGACIICGFECDYEGHTSSDCEFCGAHECSFRDEFTFNKEKHWKACVVDGCTKTIEEAEHSFYYGICGCGLACPHNSYTDGICDDCEARCTHELYSDGICSDCGAEIKIITINMTDDFGDGWNGAEVIISKLLADGSYEKIGSATLDNGSSTGTYTFIADKYDIFTLTCVKGIYPAECTITVDIDGETVFTSESFDNYKEGEIVYTNCEHTFEDGVCNTCGYFCLHSDFADGECPVCGLVGKIVTINMIDDYGDGWNGAEVIISKLLADGSSKEIGTATLDSGLSNDTYSFIAGNDVIFALTCIKGSYPAECTFTVDIAGETVFTSEYFDNYEEGEIVYTNCGHTGGIQNCGGYICEVCGKLYGEGTGEHTGGEATCDVLAVCEVCGKHYGSFIEHDTTGSDQTCLGYLCNTCNKYVGERDENNHYWYYGKCDLCLAEYPDPENCEHEWSNGRCISCGTVCEHEEFINGECTVCDYCLPFAVITGENVTYHKTFSDALEAAENDSTIKLMTYLMDYNGVDINKAITFDLNGNTWEQPSSEHHTVSANVTFTDSVGGGHLEYGVIASSPCTFEGGTYRYIEMIYATEDALEDLLGDCCDYYDYSTDELLDLSSQTSYYSAITIKANHTGGTATCSSGKICESCGKEYTDIDVNVHNYDANGKCSGCDAQAIACTTVNGITTYHLSTYDAFNAVKNCTAEDNAELKLLSDIALGDDRLGISSGNFTFDLAGHKITADHMAVEIIGYSELKPVVTITDSSETQTGGIFIEKEGGPEEGYQYAALVINCATVTIEKGTYSTNGLSGNPIAAFDCEVFIKGGAFYGSVTADYLCTMTIYDGTFTTTEDLYSCVNSGLKTNIYIYGGTYTSSGVDGCALTSYSGNITVYGGTIIADVDFDGSYKSLTLALAEGKTEGAVFKNGLKVMYYDNHETTLAESLAEGMAYWQGNNMVILSENQTEITGGDVVIKAYVEPVYSGWTEIGDSWYYYDPDTNEPVTGLTRVPYPTEEINGVTYGPDQETLDYCTSKGIEFIDAETGLFVFGEDGKFQNELTDIITYENGLRYVENGFFNWHPGLVELDGELYYFIGDEAVGGNIDANGDIYITKNNGNEDYKLGDVYNFAFGEFSGANGIVDGKYYEDSKLMTGNGLTEIEVEGETKYIYVRSNGSIVMNASYWISTNDFNIVPGMYSFDENGYMLNVKLIGKNGIYFENGAYFYYVDGLKNYAGLIRYSGTSDNGVVYDNDWIYVRSSGQLATGRYWTTKNNDAMIAKEYIFDETGAMIRTTGIVEENGNLYYYVDGVMQKCLGLIELEGKYYYVRTSGVLARNCTYWITNVNETGVIAKAYEFDSNGVMLEPEFTAGSGTLNGVVDGYYYKNGKIAYGAGLVELSDGSIIYVRSNGKLATGLYWPTTLNGILPVGCYDFGTDGRLVK